MKPKANHKQKDILFILGSSLVVVIFWIGFNIHHIWATSTVSEEVQLQLTPIEATFDTEMIQKLKSKEQVIPAYERSAKITPGQPSPSPTQTQNALELENPVASDTSRFAPTDTPISIQGQ